MRGANVRVFGKRVSAKPASPRRPTASIHPLAALCGRVLGSASAASRLVSRRAHATVPKENIDEEIAMCYNVFVEYLNGECK